MQIEISNRQSLLEINHDRISAAVTTVLNGESISEAKISIAIVGNAQIHETNRRFLNHDFATDVITFNMSDDDDGFKLPDETESETDGVLQGDIMVSAEYAIESAKKYDWSPNDELMLYIIHGSLHLSGYDDLNDSDRQVMREKESHYLQLLGMNVPAGHSHTPGDGDVS